MTKERFENGKETTVYNIFDVIYAHLVKNHSMGIHGFREEIIDDKSKHGIFRITFTSDGMLVFRAIVNRNYAMIDSLFMIQFINGKECGVAEPKNLDQIKKLLL